MEQLTRLISGTKAFESLWKQFSADKFAHAYLVTSVDPVYLHEFLVYASAMALCPKGGCFSCVTCKRVFAMGHVDVHVYPKENAKMLVKDVEELIDDCYIKPFEGDRKVYIINDFDTLDVALQNKLLKSLEEPPENTIFFLGATNESAVIATVKSRCQHVHVDDTSFEEVMQYLTHSGIDELSAEIVAGFCNNRPLLAEQYANDKTFFKMFDDVLDAIKNLNSSKDALMCSSKLVSYASKPQTLLQTLLLIYREALVSQSNEDMLLLKHKKDDILCIGQKYSQQALYNVINLLSKAKLKFEYNCNATAIVDWLVLSILEVKHKCQK